MQGYFSKLFVSGEDGTRPFIFEPFAATVNDDDAKKKAAAWFENERPFNYEPLNFDLWQGDRHVWSFPLQKL